MFDFLPKREVPTFAATGEQTGTKVIPTTAIITLLLDLVTIYIGYKTGIYRDPAKAIGAVGKTLDDAGIVVAAVKEAKADKPAPKAKVAKPAAKAKVAAKTPAKKPRKPAAIKQL
jgi:hypothetical protein